MSDAERLRPVEWITRPLADFGRSRVAGGILLAVATAVALVWANSGFAGAYASLRSLPIALAVGDFSLAKPLGVWVNDGLMGVFFFVVGLEIKRELLVGELSSPRRAALPILAGAGGMLAPAALYLALNPAGPAAYGWGIPVATDIAFALGVVALLGERAPAGLRVFLTALAIADDIGAILVIAVFYTESLRLASLGVAGALLAVSAAANAAGVRSVLAYFVIGMVVWVAFLESGVHATLAAVLMAFTIPARTRLECAPFLGRMERLIESFRARGAPAGRDLLPPEQHEVVEEMIDVCEGASAPLQRLEHALMPFVTFVVLPVFALANAGVPLTGIGEAIRNPVTAGVVLGLLAGKPLGIALASAAGVRLGLADLPEGVRWSQLFAVGLLAGIGFTMSLFISELAFDTSELRDAAKIGILSASLIAGLLGSGLLALAGRGRREAPAPARAS